MMKPLISMQRALTWFCVCPVVESDEKRKKIVYIMFSVIVFGTLLFYVAAGVVCVWGNLSIDFEKSLDSLHPVVGTSPLLCVYVIILCLKREVVDLFDELSEIYNKYAEEDVFRYLARANNESEIIWRKYMKYVFCGFGISYAWSCLSSVLRLIYMKQDFDIELVYVQFKISLPWDQTTLMGYFAESCSSIFACQIYLLFSGVILVLFVSICHLAFYKMVRYLIGKLDDFSEDRKDVRPLCELIGLHCSARGWFDTTARIYNLVALVFLLFFILALACIVYEIYLLIKAVLTYYMALKTLSAD